MYGMMDGVFGSGGGMLTAEPRVYELTGRVGALGIVGMVLGIILWAAVVTALVMVIIELVRRQRRSPLGPAFASVPVPPLQRGADTGVPQTVSEALRILDERYARGEIDHEEYEQRKGRLTGV